MKIHIYRKWKRALACWLILFLTLAQPAYSLAGNTYETEFLNDRAADIIGSAPLQAAGLVVPEGLTGKGVIVGLADSGLDKGSLTDLPADLQSSSGRIPRVVMLKSFTDREVPDDPIGHGTHMAGTIVGSGEASDGQFKGIAPGASLYFQALLDQEGKISIPANLENLFTPAYQAGVRIHVDAWGEEGNKYSVRSAQADKFVYEHPDFLIIFGAGNKGPGRSTLTDEANSKNALTVGCSQIPRPVFSPEALFADQAADSSSRGPTQDGRIKPELLAPGSALISLASRLIDSNYAANPAYTRMGGSSMSASVSAGAAAILEEYLQKYAGVKEPSSALLKALLIQGARSPRSGPSETGGFGILDLAGTILPLQEKTTRIAPIQNNLHEGDTLEYHFVVDDPAQPFKATLSWIDPAVAQGSAGQLVDNLDLQVIDPQGQVLRGNDFKKLGFSDNKNNTEQVVIEKPQAGEYLIRVQAAHLAEELPGSHLALIYGQTMIHEIVQSIESGTRVQLASGAFLDLNAYNVKGSRNGGQVLNHKDALSIGCDLYLSGKNIYSFSGNWDTGGVQILKEPQGTLVVEMNPEAREGGYFITNQMLSPSSFLLNGIQVASVSEIPAGVKIHADINPGQQTIWSIVASYKEVNGYVDSVDPEKQELKLLQDSTLYKLASWTAYVNNENLLETPDADAPYGSFSRQGKESLSPSASVTMKVSPSTNEIQNINIKTNVVVGNVVEFNTQNQSLKLDNGKEYTCFTGAKIYRDEELVSLKDIKPGDKVAGGVLGNGRVFVQLQAYSRVVYGRVVYYNSQQKSLYLLDSSNQFNILTCDEPVQIYKNGLKMENSSVVPGEWVRLVLDPDSGTVWRIDLAKKKQEDIVRIFKSYDANRNIVETSDGSLFKYTSATQMSKAGFNYAPDLLAVGEKLKISTLEYPGSEIAILARIEVESGPENRKPQLQVDVSQLNGVLVIKGSTSADRIMAIRRDGSRLSIPVHNDGSFSQLLTLSPGELSIQILAIDSISGGIDGVEREIESMGIDQNPGGLIDINGTADQSSIKKLVGLGIVSGVGNGSFLPAQPINRAEFLTMLGKARGWKLDDSIERLSFFIDDEKIPWWALGSIYFARQNQFICGYPDGSFRPQNYLTRSEMVTILGKVLMLKEKPGENQASLIKDYGDIPFWALPYYKGFNTTYWLQLFGDGSLEPGQTLTRAEAVDFIEKIFFTDSSPVQ